MKSIKEKAEEHLNSVYAGYDDVLKKLVKEGYVSGANYVLEEIESLIKDVSDEYPRFQQGTIIHIRLIKLLEQLKK